jgi:mRNA interferase YafQ
VKLRYHKNFQKQFLRLPIKKQQATEQAVSAFISNPSEPKLRDHALKGKWTGHRSIRAGGDLRIHYQQIDQNTVLFIAVGSHSQLYK